MSCLVSESKVHRIMEELKVEKYYATIGKSGEMTVYISGDMKIDPHKIVDAFNSSGLEEESDEMVYPLYQVEVEEEDYEQVRQWFKDKAIFRSFEYRKQLNSWFRENGLQNDNPTGRPPRIAFYSYKGGVGRSTTLAIVARLLAKEGLKVAAIDLDLEAPGLNSLLLATQRTSRFGVVDYLYHYPVLKDNIDIKQYMVKEEVKSWRRNGEPGQLWVMTAGGTRTNVEIEALRLLFTRSNREEVEISLEPNYLDKLSLIDFDLYDRQRKHVFEQLLQDVHKYTECDVILIDARTGVSNVSGAILNQFSDFLSIHIQDNRQNREGLKLISKHIHDKNKLYSAFWCHTKVPKTFDVHDNKLSIFINKLLNSNKVNFAQEADVDDTEVKVHSLPFDDPLEDITATRLKKFIDVERIRIGYRGLVERIIEVADLKKKLPFHMSQSEKKNIRRDFTRVLKKTDEIIYISGRFLDPSLKTFVGFPGSGKKTFLKYIENNMERSEIEVVTFEDFRKKTGKTRFIPSEAIFLDWSFQEATQAVSKWLLSSDVLYNWLQNNKHFSLRVGMEEWSNMRTNPEYELEEEVAEEIVSIVFGQRREIPTPSVHWGTIFRRLEYREDYVLPADIMLSVKLILGHLLKMTPPTTEDLQTLFPPIHIRRLTSLLKPIGDNKKEWLSAYDQNLLKLVSAYKQIQPPYSILGPEGNIKVRLRDKWIEMFSDEVNEQEFDNAWDKALTLGIISTFGEPDEDLYLSPVYRLIEV